MAQEAKKQLEEKFKSGKNRCVALQAVEECVGQWAQKNRLGCDCLQEFFACVMQGLRSVFA